MSKFTITMGGYTFQLEGEISFENVEKIDITTFGNLSHSYTRFGEPKITISGRMIKIFEPVIPLLKNVPKELCHNQSKRYKKLDLGAE